MKLSLFLFLFYVYNNPELILSTSNNDLLVNALKNNYFTFNQLDKNKTYKIINKNFTRNQYILKGLSFLNKIKNNKLNNIIKQYNTIPRISVIIPIYNCEKTIDLVVKSIQFQNIKDLEIILINDFSSDNSSKIIEELHFFDKRIKIINNLRNMGTLYSRCIGALKAKGEYIIGLDNDDLLLYEEILETVYLNAKVNDFDIIEIKSFNIPNYEPNFENVLDGDFIDIPNNLILFQPELGRFTISYKNNFYLRDHFAWGKCIKSNIFKTAVNRLGKERYYTYNCWTEDVSIVFVLFNSAKSFMFLNVFGIFRFKSTTTTTFKLSDNHKMLTRVFFLRILFDFSKNDFLTKKYVVQYALSFFNESLCQLNKKDNLYLYLTSTIKKLLECPFISLEYKIKIKDKYNCTLIDV